MGLSVVSGNISGRVCSCGCVYRGLWSLCTLAVVGIVESCLGDCVCT